MEISTKELRDSLNNMGSIIKNSVAEVLQSSDFISRTIGMNDSYEGIMYIVQALGREPVSLLGKDFPFIYDHVRRNYEEGTTINGMRYGVDTSATGDDYSCAKFTFYKERPTIRFADPMTDPMNLLDRWMPDFKLNSTKADKNGFYYAESHDDATNNIDINSFEANTGTESGKVVNSIKSDAACDLIRKTNDYFKHGKYRTLVARFHTDSMDSKDITNHTQTAISRQYGMSHGRNLLSGVDPVINGYDNPYCRVWTYHHQYHTMLDTIRPFQGADSQVVLEDTEGEGKPVSFRTIASGDFASGSERLDKHGVLNYDNGFVNIAPKAKIVNYFDGKEDDKDEKTVSIKRCMFSIENLAWKDKNKNHGSGDGEYDPYGLSAEQKGPLGGRIMWFPPYDLKFSETSSARWNSNEFIGRGENIYTYTNTERRGNISFKLLIDHPAIIDYWKRRDEEPDYSGVDDIKSKESELLRFFAGCDILKAKPQTYQFKKATSVPEVKNEEKKPEPSEPDPQKIPPKKKKLYCFVFYPNNYSGMDDRNGVVNPIHYLLNGIGTQKTVNSSTKNADDFAVDMMTNVNTTVGSGYGGYEMRSGKGISVVTSPIEMVYDSIYATYADTTTKERKAQYLTDSHGVSVSTATHILAKQIGDEADSLGSAKGKGQGGCSTLVTEEPHTWYRKRWYYRVDKNTENQDLLNYKNYIDTDSNGFNSNVGLSSVKSLAESEFGITFTDDDDIVSLTDMYMALEKGAQDVFSGLYDDKNVKIISDIKDNENKRIKISSIKLYGHASSHNNTTEEKREERNTSLAKNRAETFKNWLNNNNFPDIAKAVYEEVPGVQKGGKNGDVNAKEPKFWRSAHIVIEYEQSDEEPAQVTNSETQEVTVDAGTDKERKVEEQKVTSYNIETPKDKNKAENVNFAGDLNYESKTGTWEAPQEYRTTAESMKDIEGVGKPMGELTEKGKEEVKKNIPGVVQVRAEDTRNIGTQMYGKPKTTAESIITGAGNAPQVEEDKVEEKEKEITYETKVGPVERYDNEGEFFKMLDKKDPFLHHLISEKIKYFDPAFHSISPEGFNARLTFLQQCTRQGSTIGNSDIGGMTAYNMAFGRPPVCVLRVGDFYYTKIIIESVNIDYDDMQWDLNPEGIGVMPMMANIKIDFKFIGGSDLAGPIARLQNAVSFNYYANTSVYDDRAEMVEYGTDKTGKEIAYKPYIYPSINAKEKKELNEQK